MPQKKKPKKIKQVAVKNKTSIVQAPRGRKRKSGKRYFTEITERAICAYNKITDERKKNKIYSRFIHRPMDKMAEILINTDKYIYIDLLYEDLKNAVIGHLSEKLYMYKSENGKAFSYFNRVAKNFLIQLNDKEYKKRCIHKQVEAIDLERNVSGEYYGDTERDNKKEFLDKYILFLDENLGTFFNNKRDISIADSVITLMRERNLIETYNKKALYILIRERCRLHNKDTQHITKVLNIIKVDFNKRFIEYQDTGGITSLQQNLFFR